MTTPTHSSDDPSETAAKLRRERPASDGFDLDAELHMAQLIHKHAEAEGTSVQFRRWRVERRLGRGGMGTVYLARDTTLGRLVALKLIRAADGHAFQKEQGRAIREAQALAACDHANIVRVLSIDDGAPGLVILEMEYVDGTTLRRWCSDTRRSVVEILRAYADAADGLSAIHARNIVHRDIKPDNLLISASGTVKVTDFGLAIGGDSSTRQTIDDGKPSQDSSPLSLRVTSAGALVGTHGYIAPEVLAGAEATAQSDQFSLATALWESLVGVLPFQGNTPHALVLALRSGAPQLPSTARPLPDWALRAVQRALEFRPEDRFASVADFAAALRRGLGRRKRWLRVLSLIGVVSLSGAFAWWSKPPPPDPCTNIGQPLSDSWMAERADLASAESTSPARALLIASLDDGVRSWVDTRRRLCSSSRRSSPLDITAMESSAHQEACLAHSLHSYQALIAGLGDSRADDPVHDSELAGEIEALPSCEDRRIFDRWPLTKSTKEDEALASTLAAALTLELDGQHAAAEARAREVAAVDPREHPRRHAEALYRVGHILGSQHRLSAAYDALNAAYLAALRSGHDTLACQSAIYRAKLAANVGLDIESSNRALADAKAWRERSGLRSPVLEADLIEAEGLLAEAKGEFRRAADLHKEALDLRRGALGSSHPDVSKSLHNLANALSATGGDAARAQALVLLNEAIQLRERLLGADNPATADALLDLAYLESASDPRAARADLGRAQKIFEGAAGDHSVSLSNIQITLAQLARGEDDLERAATHLAEARRLQGETRDLPLTHYDRALLELEEGQLALQRMDFARSRQSLTQAIQLFRHRNLDSQEALDAQVLWIEAVRGLGDHGAIANLIVGEGPTIVGHLLGFSAEDRGKIAWYVADSLKQTGALTEAASFFRTALRAYQELEDHPSIAELRWELAQSLVSDESGLERESLAQEALDYYRDQKNRQMVATISRWLTKHKHQGQKSLHPTKSTQ